VDGGLVGDGRAERKREKSPETIGKACTPQEFSVPSSNLVTVTLLVTVTFQVF
jgi:hypothetical protein